MNGAAEGMAYLHGYAARLTSCHTAEDIFGGLMKWQFDHCEQSNAAADELNVALKLPDDGHFKAHIPTVAVGSLTGLLIVAANPGWNPARNGREHDDRRHRVEKNRQFCENFFSVWPGTFGGSIGWWTKAIRTAQAFHDISVQPETTRARWSWAADSRAVGCIDLCPLHSKRDRFSALLLRKHSPAASALHGVAMATLRMVVRLRPAPHAVLVASSTGSSLIAQDHRSLLLEPAESASVVETGAWARDLKVYRSAWPGPCVVTYPGQVFSGAWRPPAGFSLAAFGREVRRRVDEVR